MPEDRFLLCSFYFAYLIGIDFHFYGYRSIISQLVALNAGKYISAILLFSCFVISPFAEFGNIWFCCEVQESWWQTDRQAAVHLYDRRPINWANTSRLIDVGICQQSLFITKQSFITFGSNIPGLFYSPSVFHHSNHSFQLRVKH